jgi:ATP-binding cassette subfamily B protein
MKNLLTLKKYFAVYKVKLFWGFIFIILSNAGSLYIPLLIKNAINDLQKTTAVSGVLFHYALLIVLTSLFAGFFRFMIRQKIIVVSREIEYDLRHDFWKHIQLLPLRYFQNNSTGNVMAHATNDINAVRMFIGPAVMYSIDTTISLLIIIPILISLNLSLTLYALLPLPFLAYAAYRVGKLIHKKFTLIQEKFSELTTMAQENYAGIRVVKSYVREDSETNLFKVLSSDYVKRNMEMIKIQAFIMPILFLITGLSLIIVVWLGGIKVIQHEMNLGQIAAFIVYLGELIWPMIAFGWVTNIIQQAEASMKRLNKIFAEPYEINDRFETDYSIKEINGKITFRNVSFRYGENLPYILKNIDLEIKQGQTIAVMGYTGSGKTSFINLIPRMYDVTDG